MKVLLAGLCVLFLAGCSGDSADTSITTISNDFDCVVEVNGHQYAARVKQQETPEGVALESELTPLDEEGEVIEEGDVNYEPGDITLPGDVCSNNRIGSSEEVDTDTVTTNTNIQATGVAQ